MSKILVVDDDSAGRELVTTVLGYSGHEMTAAGDGLEGLDLARAKQPDLIIADLLMPTMDGFEFVRRLREDPLFANTPVVFYTASYLESEARQLADACGVRHILTKPVEPHEILEVVAQALGVPTPPMTPLPVEEFHREHLGLLTAKLSQKAGHAIPRLNAMIELSLQFASERDPAHLLETFCNSVRKIIGARHSVVAVLDRQEPRWRHFYASGMDAQISSRMAREEPSPALRDAVLAQRRPLRQHGLPGDPTLVGLPSEHPPVHSFLCVPITSPDRIYGWHCLSNKIGGTEFSEEDEGLAQILAAQVGRIYENGSLYEEVKREAEELEHEIAGRMRLEAELRESKDHFQRIFQNSPVAISISTLEEGRLLDVNDAFLEMLGHRREEVIGRTTLELGLHRTPEERARFVDLLRQQQLVHNMEARFATQAGEARDVLISAEMVQVRGEWRVIVIANDITDRKQLETQLRQAQKMESVGRLAGGVAHDFNNLLTLILGHAANIETVDDLPPAVAEAASEITQAADRAANLTRQLLAFSRRQVLQPRNLDLSRVVTEMARLLRRLLGDDIALTCETEPHLPLVCADASMIEQILLNLAVNARDAMPRGGRLTVALSVETLREEDLRQNSEAAVGRFVRIKVTDTGCGIPPEILPRIFEPFFTTKAVGRGTGLGLATVYGIVKQHQGWITLDSKVGHGTTFQIYLPAAQATQELPEPSAGPQTACGGCETILLVEDAQAVRQLTRNILEGRGYTVLEARTGPDAQRLYQQRQGRIDLLLTDIMMPDGLTGLDLVEQLRRQNSRLKVILTSGYSPEMVGVDQPQRTAWKFLQKPFTPTHLLQTVRTALDIPA